MIRVIFLMFVVMFLTGCETVSNVSTEKRVIESEEAVVTPCGAGTCMEY